MKTNLTKTQILGIVVAVIGSFLVAHYDSLIPYRFKEFKSEEGKFTVLMPGVPSSEKTEVGKEGERQTIHIFTAQPRAHLAFSCAYVDFASAIPELQTEAALDSARDGSIKNVQGKFIKEVKLTAQGYPARQFQAETRGAGYMDAKLILVGQRLYILMVANTKGAQQRDQAEVERFLDSFKLLAKS